VRAEETIRLANRYDRQFVAQLAYSCLGHAYAGLGQWAEAEAAYTQALAGPGADLPRCAMENVAGLAYIRWQMGDEATARTHIQHFLALSNQSLIEGSSSPGLSYGRAVEVLRGLGEASLAQEFLHKTAGWLSAADYARLNAGAEWERVGEGEK
jgi:hypothetical protein